VFDDEKEAVNRGCGRGDDIGRLALPLNREVSTGAEGPVWQCRLPPLGSLCIAREEPAMTAFRILLIALFLTVAVYTALVAGQHGLNLLPVFFGDIATMAWPGQFDVDFTSLLTLSALWLAWRHHFSAAGLALAVLGFFGGGLFLSAYLLFASFQANGDAKILLLGRRRVQA
jgi:hypothetical protein